MPAAGGIISLSFSFFPVMIIATLFIDVTVPGHDTPGGRNESPVQSGDVGRLPSPDLFPSFVSVPLAKDVAPYFCDYIFHSRLLSRKATFAHFLLYPDSFCIVFDNERIVDRLRRFGIPSLSRSHFSRSWSSTEDRSTFPTTSSRQERLECLNKCLNYTVREK